MSTDLAPTPQAQAANAMGSERGKLKKSLRRMDLVFITLAALIAIDTIAVTAGVGRGQALVWLAVLIIVYLVPYGMIVSELGAAFPYEGGPYVWPRMAFGRLAGSLTSVFYWMSNPVWMGGTLAATTVATINTFYLKNAMGTAPSIVVGVLVV